MLTRRETRPSRLCILGLVCVLGRWPAGEVSAQVAARAGVEVGPMADEVVKVLKRNGKGELTIGQFRTQPQAAASSGPAIKKALIDQLTNRGIAIKRRAEWGFEGNYRLVDQVDTGGLAVQIQGQVVDDAGVEIFSGTWYLGTEPEIMALFGPTVDLPLDQGPQARKRAIRESIQAPKAAIKETRIAGGSGDRYALEILVGSDDRWAALPPTDEEGLAMVPIERGQRYAVSLINDSPEDAAVTLTIDGLNMFAFSDNKDYSYVIVPKRSKGLIRGWHRTNEKSDAFLVTEYAKGAAVELGGDSSQIGTITATFAAAWPVGEKAPQDELPLLASRGGANATARGPEVRASYQVVERKVGIIRSAISVRYDRPH